MTNYNTEPEFVQTFVLRELVFAKWLTQTYVRDILISEQTFGVDEMVQVQLIGSDSLKSNDYTYGNRKTRTGRTSVASARAKSAASARFIQSIVTIKGLRLILIPIVALLIYAGLSMMSASAEPESVRPAMGSEATVTVDSGDTLWSIAEGAKPAGMKTVAAVHLIMKRNGLTSSSISSGQRLVLPSKLSDSSR